MPLNMESYFQQGLNLQTRWQSQIGRKVVKALNLFRDSMQVKIDSCITHHITDILQRQWKLEFSPVA